MVTVIVPTTNRPHMLRTALRSIEKQTARAEIALVIVSENAGNRESGEVCSEFSTLPIQYLFRDPPLPPLEHSCALIRLAHEAPNPYVAILHDDDWWGINHLSTGLDELRRNPDAVAYWATSFLVHGESSWFMQCWNESCWVASGFQPTTEVVKLTLKEAALACVTSGPAHFSSLIGRRDHLVAALTAANETGNLHDSDRLLFLEFAKRGPLLVNFIPEVFVRQHPAQDQRSLTLAQSSEHVANATRIILEFCKEQGIDILSEFERLYEQCPVPSYQPYMIGTMDPRVMQDLDRLNMLPLARLAKPPAPPPEPVEPPAPAIKRLVRYLCPPILWHKAALLKGRIRARRERRNQEEPANP